VIISDTRLKIAQTLSTVNSQ